MCRKAVNQSVWLSPDYCTVSIKSETMVTSHLQFSTIVKNGLQSVRRKYAFITVVHRSWKHRRFFRRWASLSEDATCAKQKRWPLEWAWKKTGVESDRLTYQWQCKAANKMINETLRKHYVDRIADVNTGSKNRWCAINELLYNNDRPASPSQKCAKIQSAFFYNEVRCMKQTLASRLLGQIHHPFAFNIMHCETNLDGFTTVVVNEVIKLLNTMSAKSSPIRRPYLKSARGCSRLRLRDLQICRLTRVNFHHTSGKLKSLLSWRRLEWTSTTQQATGQ